MTTKNLKLKGNSLVEVLIVLGIISTALVASVSVIVNSLIKVRVNEIEDSANSLLIQSMEIAKTPNTVVVNDGAINNNSVGTAYYFTLQNASNQNTLQRVTSSTTLINSCPANSPYNANNFLGTNVDYNICIQLQIIYRGNEQYEINSRVVYDINGRVSLNTIQGFRYTPFNIP